MKMHLERLNRAAASMSATLLLLAAAGCTTTQTGQADAVAAEPPDYPDPTRFEEAIRGFEARDAEGMPPEDAILFVGSSSIAIWNQHLPADMAPLEVIPRGFGGSNMNDVLYYADRIVFPYEPKAIVVYEGDNDIAGGLSAEQVLDSYREFVARVDQQLPGSDIFFLSVKPSIARWSLWPEMDRFNEMLEAYAAGRQDLHFIDVSSAMLNEQGEPRPEFLIEDNLHMNRAGYAVWTDIVKSRLLETYGR